MISDDNTQDAEKPLTERGEHEQEVSGHGLDIRGLEVKYGSVTAVSGFDIHVAKGEVVALLGPSGWGKSSVLSAVTGIITPSAGSITWNGSNLAGIPTHQRGVGMMFQDHALFPHRDVTGNIAFGLRMQKKSKVDTAARVEAMLDLVGLAGYGDRQIDELSGGQQQRVALARALAPEPRMLLLDEPLGALDRDLRDRLANDLRAIFTTTGTTVLYVTHDQHEAEQVADRIVTVGN